MPTKSFSVEKYRQFEKFEISVSHTFVFPKTHTE